ncbi:MAG: hypothetical protein IID42_00050 [Planctomycetes bacterium]|nr:hypothetical protein [Planctomycetota bacterium]
METDFIICEGMPETALRRAERFRQEIRELNGASRRTRERLAEVLA